MKLLFRWNISSFLQCQHLGCVLVGRPNKLRNGITIPMECLFLCLVHKQMKVTCIRKGITIPPNEGQLTSSFLQCQLLSSSNCFEDGQANEGKLLVMHVLCFQAWLIVVLLFYYFNYNTIYILGFIIGKKNYIECPNQLTGASINSGPCQLTFGFGSKNFLMAVKLKLTREFKE